MERRTLLLGATSAAIAVAAGAFGAHELRTRIAPEMLAVFETGARYQMYHALALVMLGLSTAPGSHRLTRWCFGVGTLLFSGSLYMLALTGERWWGAVTPLGGAGFLAGWICLAITAYRER